jgi:hypothetical protein
VLQQPNKVNGILIENDGPNGSVFGVYPWGDSFYLDVRDYNSMEGDINIPVEMSTVVLISLLRNSLSNTAYIRRNGQTVAQKNMTSSPFTHINKQYTISHLQNSLRGYLLELIIFPKFMNDYIDIENAINSYYQIF